MTKKEKHIFSFHTATGPDFTIRDTGVEIIVLINNAEIRKRGGVEVRGFRVSLAQIPRIIAGLTDKVKTAKSEESKAMFLNLLKQMVPDETVVQNLLDGWKVEFRDSQE
jgi:hypothetical protein